MDINSGDILLLLLPSCNRQSVHTSHAPVGETTTKTVNVSCFIFYDRATGRGVSEACIPAAWVRVSRGRGPEPGAEQMQRNSTRLETRCRGGWTGTEEFQWSFALHQRQIRNTDKRSRSYSAQRKGGEGERRAGKERGNPGASAATAHG